MIFCIPLMPRVKAGDWTTIGRLLDNTLRSIANQTRAGSEVILAAHELPDDFDDHGLDLTVLTAGWIPDPAGKGSADRGEKKRLLDAEAARRGGGYVMVLDADDLVSARLAEHVHATADPFGYTMKVGYVLDRQAGTIATIPGAWPRSFDYYCGSCAVMKVTPDDLIAPDDGHNYWRSLGAHSRWAERSAERGRPLQPVPFPAVIYMQNTGENLHTKVDEQRRREVQTNIAGAAIPLTEDIRREFAIDLPTQAG